MDLSGEFAINAPREVVFKALRDASSFVRFVDSVNDLKEIDSTHYEAKFETRVAYIQFKFAVTAEVTRIEQPSEIEARIGVTPFVVVGLPTAKTPTKLTDAGNKTRVSYAVESTLAGRLGSIGRPVLRAKATEMERQFAARLCSAFASPS